MSKILCRQYTLESKGEHLTAWLDNTKLAKGMSVTLKDSMNPLQWWAIVGVGSTVLAKSEIKGAHNSVGWHDNDFHGKLKGLTV